jgi:hypothetical protein
MSDAPSENSAPASSSNNIDDGAIDYGEVIDPEDIPF